MSSFRSIQFSITICKVNQRPAKDTLGKVLLLLVYYTRPRPQKQTFGQELTTYIIMTPIYLE